MAACIELEEYDLKKLELSDLVTNIWKYSNVYLYYDSVIHETYRKCYIDELKNLWKDNYLGFDYVVNKLCHRDEQWSLVSKMTKKMYQNSIKKLRKSNKLTIRMLLKKKKTIKNFFNI